MTFQIYVKFHLSYCDKYGDLVESFDRVYKAYLKKPSGFAFDLIAILPIDVLALAAPSEKRMMVLALLRLIHVIRLKRVSEFFGSWEKELDIK